MVKKNKKALSTIVTTLLFVVLGLVAIGGIWLVVRNVLQNNSKNVQTGTLIVDLDAINAYEEAGVVNVKVTRKTGQGEISKIKFILSDGGDQEVITKEVKGFDEFETLDFILTPTKLIPSTILTVSIAPVTISGDTEIVGEITDIQTLRNLYASGEDIPGEENPEGENPLCTPDCGSKICGAAPNGCGGANACNVCQSGTCSEDQLTCEGCTPVSSCSAGIICGTVSNGCGGELDCGTCPEGQLCNSLGTLCDAVMFLNSGIVDDTWPGDSGLYFGSSSLPTDVSYQNKWVKFPGSEEIGCKQIVIYRFPVEGYANSHIGFNFETSIKALDSYQIFESFSECNA